MWIQTQSKQFVNVDAIWYYEDQEHNPRGTLDGEPIGIVYGNASHDKNIRLWAGTPDKAKAIFALLEKELQSDYGMIKIEELEEKP